MGDTTDQVITSVRKVDARFSHVGNYTTNKIYCGDLLWQSSLTLPAPDRYARFADSADVLSCPLCHSALKLQEGSLVCPKRHCFDIAKQGYVNLLGPSRQSAHYSKESFESRRAILEAGYYDHVKEAVLTAVGRALSPSEGPAAVNATPFRVLDAGCGEGFYARAIRENLCVDVVAFDLSKDAMLMAARHDSRKAVKWLVGDLTNIPVLKGSINCVVDVFAPSNYDEFKRVLTPTRNASAPGVLVKVVPGSNHLTELRHLAEGSLRSKEYSNQLVTDCFEKHFKMTDRIKVTRTFEMSERDVRVFAEMTPLLFGIDAESLNLSRVKSITIEAELLVGTPRSQGPS